MRGTKKSIHLLADFREFRARAIAFQLEYWPGLLIFTSDPALISSMMLENLALISFCITKKSLSLRVNTSMPKPRLLETQRAKLAFGRAETNSRNSASFSPVSPSNASTMLPQAVKPFFGVDEPGRSVSSSPSGVTEARLAPGAHVKDGMRYPTPRNVLKKPASSGKSTFPAPVQVYRSGALKTRPK